MFKVGDIVKFKDEYYQDIQEPYTIISELNTISGSFRIKGIITKRKKSIQSFALEYDIIYIRKLKLEKICTKLVT